MSYIDPMELKPSVLRTLGGRKVLKSGTVGEVRRRIARGLRGYALAHVERTLHLSVAESVSIFGISPATRKRILKAKVRPLPPVVADRAVRAARIFGEAVDHFGNQAVASDWLRARILALGDERPIDLLDTDIGAQTVHQLLVQMEHGMVS